MKPIIENVDNALVNTNSSAKMNMNGISITFRPFSKAISAAALMNQTQLNETENISISIGNVPRTKLLQAESQ